MGMTNEAIIIFHGSNPNESKSWSRDGISDSTNEEDFIWLWLDPSSFSSLFFFKYFKSHEISKNIGYEFRIWNFPKNSLKEK